MSTLGQYSRSLLDEHPEIMCILFGIILLAMIVLIIRRIKHGSQLKKANEMLAAGQIAEAHALFLQLARARFSDSTVVFKKRRSTLSLFEQAMNGLTQVYAKAGIAVDFQPIRELQQDLAMLRKDKKLHSVWGNSANENLTAEGVKIKQSIEANAKIAFDRLPACNTPGTVRSLP